MVLLRKKMILGSCLIAFTTPALACWVEAGARYGVDPKLLCGLGKVESHFRPQAENISHYQRTKSTDIGELGVNSRWLKKLAKYGLTREDLFDSCTSRNIGAWILSDLFARKGESWDAVGAYNAACTNLSPEKCHEARSGYAWKVYHAMNSNECRKVGQP